MPRFPVISGLLPSKALLALEEYFLERLQLSGLNYLGQPKYDFYEDSDVYRLIGTSGYRLAEKAFDRASLKYRKKD